MKLPKCAIFDFNGVIVINDRKRLQNLNMISKKYGIKIPPIKPKDYIGKRVAETLEQYANGRPKYFKKIAEEMRVLERGKILEYPMVRGIKGILKFLKKNKIPIYLSTTSVRPTVEKFLKHKGIFKYFDFMVTGSEFFHSKDEKFFHVILDKIKIKPEDAVVIEDSIKGVEAAKKAGCIAFGLTTYLEKSDLKIADKVFKDHSEIKNFFEKL